MSLIGTVQVTFWWECVMRPPNWLHLTVLAENSSEAGSGSGAAAFGRGTLPTRLGVDVPRRGAQKLACNVLQVALAQDDKVVEALLTQVLHKSLGVGVYVRSIGPTQLTSQPSAICIEALRACRAGSLARVAGRDPGDERLATADADEE